MELVRESDGLHFNAAGYELLARAVVEAAQQAFGSDPARPGRLAQRLRQASGFVRYDITAPTWIGRPSSSSRSVLEMNGPCANA